VLGTVVVLGGLGLSGLTLYAHQTGNVRLAGFLAAASLVFVLLILVFIVPPLARNAGREASQMNLPFEFTTGGAVMLVLVSIVGFSAWNTGNNLLFLVLSFLIAALVVGFFAGNICLKKLDVTMRFPDTIFADEPTPIVGVNNRKRIFPAFRLWLTSAERA
jgi:FtsH-binding integral membrane protein